MTNIIFLDFDGVIRLPMEGGWVAPDTSEFRSDRVQAVFNLAEITGSKIVVSSDWRISRSRNDIEEMLPGIGKYLHRCWATPFLQQGRDRAHEIERWLSVYGRETRFFVILDDCAILFENASESIRERLVLCSNRFGITAEGFREAFNLLSS